MHYTMKIKVYNRGANEEVNFYTQELGRDIRSTVNQAKNL